MNRPSASRSAFTLIELLVVVAVISVLAGMLLPAVGAVRSSAQTARCGSNLMQIGTAVGCYISEWKGHLPVSYLAPPDAPTWQGYSDEVRLGSYLDSTATSGGYFSALPYDRAPWRCPSDVRTPAHYSRSGISYGLNRNLSPASGSAAISANDGVRLSRVRSPATTALATDTQECRWTPNPGGLVYSDQAKPTLFAGLPTQAPYHVFGRHRGGANVLFVDGSVSYGRTLPADVASGTVSLLP
jgi:prepilin-type N-terminal cleavage/methylation domain-containing protein/prepilin-type processing-associated H-X9-DG protein